MNLSDDPFGKRKTVSDILREQENADRLYNVNADIEERKAIEKIESKGVHNAEVDDNSLRFMAAIGVDAPSAGPRPEKGQTQTVDELFHQAETSLTVESVFASLAKIAPSANQTILKKMAAQVVSDHKR